MKRLRSALATALIGFVAASCYLTYSTVQHDRLNHDLIAAVKQGDSLKVRSLLGRGADPNVRDVAPRPWWQSLLDGPGNDRMSDLDGPAVLALVFASDRLRYRKGPLQPADVECLKALLERGAHPNVGSYNDSSTPLIVQVARLGYGPCVRLMLDRGANANARDTQGRTALFGAVYWKDTETATSLIRHHIDINARFNGRTALYYALKASNTVMVALLRQAGGKE